MIKRAFVRGRVARALVAASIATSSCLALAPEAAAQTVEHFSLDRFEPAPAGDRFFGVPGGDPGGELTLRAMLLGDYAYRPLVLYTNNGDDSAGSIVKNQLFLHASVSLGLFNRLNLSLNVPVALVSSGDSPAAGGVSVPSPSGVAFGDMSFSARLRLVGKARSPAELDVGGTLWVPTGSSSSYAGDGHVRGMPELVFSGEGDFIAYAVHAGVTLRNEQQVLETTVGNEMAAGAALGFLIFKKKLQIGPEVYGTTTLQDPFTKETSNFEGIGGVRYRAGVWVFGAGAGPGFTRGLGTPALRAVASFAYAPEPEEKPAPSDRDHDKIMDGVDACPDTAGVASDDPKKNGCPPDRDGDGIIDAEDACPDVPGIHSDDKEQNGCPGDKDGDGIRDDKDACPEEKGPPDPDPQKNGCPSLVRVTKTEIVILQQVQFKTGSDVILPASDELLGQVAGVLNQHSEIKHIEVQGHTDNRGSATYNKKLSERRAASVVRWLSTRGGVDAARLVAKGYGMDQPLDDNSTEAGRQRNRRVQFKITDMRRSDDTSEKGE